jgi:hypothetical protein
MLLNFQLVHLTDAKPFVSIRSQSETNRLIRALSGALDPHPYTHICWIGFEIETLFTITLQPLCAKYRPT